MGETRRRWPLAVLIVLVSLAGGLVGGFFGLLSSLPYGMEGGPSENVGGLLGVISGVLAGVIWCAILIPKLRWASAGGVILRGCLWGIGVGLASTLVVHVGLWIQHRVDFGILAIGLTFGSVAGVCVGFAAGVMALIAKGMAGGAGAD